jgi:hypothetical protein
MKPSPKRITIPYGKDKVLNIRNGISPTRNKEKYDELVGQGKQILEDIGFKF